MVLADHSPTQTEPDESALIVMPVDLGHAVTAAIRELIMTGAVAPGERLVETDLSERFGTSRGPVRDAFKELEQSGLVISVPRRGTFVATLTATDIHEIYTLRLALEKLAISTTATIATDHDIAAMRAAVERLTEAQRTSDRRAGAEADIAIHRLIVRTAGHERLTEAWERLADQTLLLMAELMDLLLDVQHAAGDHDALVNAISDHDVAGAEAALTDHLLAASQAMIDNASSTNES
ncbi:GntR family transcriptional regulator [Acidimicrobiales bacterium]|nr:GntR family transcriptional regulator [Acidimicrobiales bacterium]